MQTLIPSILAMLISSTFHEYAHAFTAYKLGDDTAKAEGRMTLNPLAHIDPIGLISMLITGIGWSKPVPVNSYNFENPKKGNALVSIAGPISNVVLAFVSAGLLKLVLLGLIPPFFVNFIYTMLIINISLALFNLMPIPPLDGSHILELFIPRKFTGQWITIQKYAPFLVFALFLPVSPIFALFNKFWYNLLFTVMNAITSVFGI